MLNFMRHDLVWVDDGLPYVVTTQQAQPTNLLRVAQCLTAEKTSLSRVSSEIEISRIIRHEKPILFTTLLTDFSLQQQLFMDISAVKKLCNELAKQRLVLRVFGSCSWQYFTKQAFIKPESDIDIVIYIDNNKQLTILQHKLIQLEELMMRKIDGELVLANRYFVAWRELFNAQDTILVKTNQQSFLIEKQELLLQCLK